MAIQEGEKIPEVTLHHMVDGRPAPVTTTELTAGKKVVIFAVPGAFTPTCSEMHLPGFVDLADDIKSKGVDDIICVSVNDPFVMDAWGKDRNADSISMIADGSGHLAEALGLVLDLSGGGLGKRSQRYAMVVDDGTVTKLAVEEGGRLEASKAEAIIEAL